jgi:hypothetical protein
MSSPDGERKCSLLRRDHRPARRNNAAMQYDAVEFGIRKKPPLHNVVVTSSGLLRCLFIGDLSSSDGATVVCQDTCMEVTIASISQ